LLEVVQLVVIGAASTANDSTLANALLVLYLAPVVLIAAGAITAGAAIRRRSPAVGPILLPRLLIAIRRLRHHPDVTDARRPFVLGQLGLGGLMLFFAILGGLLQSTKS
jgi:hypothetical protein